ncbi:hypothetical protein [Paracoccus zhejiangensis]|uniref:Uncharacterized protein n=1 Tax=Paracoccus zhejiangensis TaxID=1077935 RepID=A0A2H5F2M3_9RHOB|nr:hypothetical protein [Paracoccus zhejiangensis]AUH65799.1 hypothetical protein CX676_17880 [Paracoccus zhejiangensis]
MKDISTNPVRVSLPASVASDIDRLKKAVGSVLGHLGCQACCSGHDIMFELQRDFIFEKDVSEHPVSLPGRRGLASGKTLDIGLNPDAAGNIDTVFAAIDKLAELTGHVACATGCDWRFNLERSLVLDARMNLREQVMTIG